MLFKDYCKVVFFFIFNYNKINILIKVLKLIKDYTVIKDEKSQSDDISFLVHKCFRDCFTAVSF